MASTTTVAVDALPDRVRVAIEASAERQGLHKLLVSAVAACCTTGDAVRKRFGRVQEAPVDYLVLTPAYVISARDGDRPETVIWTLANADIRFVTESLRGATVTGLAITAFRPGAAERGTGFLPVADDADGRAFAELVTKDVA